METISFFSHLSYRKCIESLIQQKNLFEKLLLIIMDISGNIKDNVKTIPIYFNIKSLNNFIEKNKIKKLEIESLYRLGHVYSLKEFQSLSLKYYLVAADLATELDNIEIITVRFS